MKYFSFPVSLSLSFTYRKRQQIRVIQEEKKTHTQRVCFVMNDRDDDDDLFNRETTTRDPF